MTEDVKLFPKVEVKARDLGIHEGHYSLALEMTDAHVDLRTHQFDHRPGNLINVALFGLTTEAILQLGFAIIREYIKITNKEGINDSGS